MATTKNPAVLWNVEQVLTSAEQTQARENIGFPTATASGQVLVYGTSTTIEWGKFLVKNVGTPNWNDLNRSGFYNIANSQSAGTDNSPEGGAVSLLAGSRGGESGQFTTQLVMGSDLFYRTKPSNGSWESWRPVLYQYKDTITSSVEGFKLATTTVGSTVGSRTHYTALINITPTGTGNNTNNPYFAYLEIYQVMEATADRTQIRLKMLSTPSTSDTGTASPYVIRGTNRGSSSGNYSHEWYITRPPSTGASIDNVTITVTPILCEGDVTFKGLARSTSIPSGLDAYIETGSATPAFGSTAWGSTTGRPLYLSTGGTLEPCDNTALAGQINGTSIGSASTPVYIDSTGKPTPCTILVGSGSVTVPTSTINNHMYTAIPISTGTSYNANGTGTGQTGYEIFEEVIPPEYIPHDSPRSWPAGIMLFVNASIWIDNTDSQIQQAGRVVFILYQDSTQLASQNLGILTTQDGHLPVSFSAITVNPTAYNTKFKLKVIGYDAAQENVRVVKVWSVSYTLTALI